MEAGNHFDIKTRLFHIFMRYATIGSKLKNNYIQVPQLYQFAQDTQIIDKRFTRNKLQLALTALNQNNSNLDFSKFLELLAAIAEQKYPKGDQGSSSLKKLLLTHVLPLEEGQQEDPKLDQHVIVMLRSVLPGLRQIYRRYFEMESKGSPVPQEILTHSLKSLEQLLRDIDICPTFFPKARLYQLWRDQVILRPFPFIYNYILPDPRLDFGFIFTFSKFVKVLYDCSIICYPGETSGKQPSDKVLAFLERMELHRSNLRNMFATNTATLSLIPPAGLLESQTSKTQPETVALTLDSEGQWREQNSLHPFEAEGAHMGPIERNQDQIFRIFQQYCMIGEPTNTKGLQSLNFIRMMKDADLLRDYDYDDDPSYNGRITTVEADLMYSKLGRQSDKSVRGKSKYLQFPQFLQALEMVGRHWDPDRTFIQCMEDVISHLLKLATAPQNDKGTTKRLSSIIQEVRSQDFGNLLQIIFESFEYYYRYYADDSGNIRFKNFFDFCRDFSIFPDMLPKVTVYKLFKLLIDGQQPQFDASIGYPSSSALEVAVDQSNEWINVTNFLEAIVVLAKFTQEEGDYIACLCSFIEKLAQSDGSRIVLAARGHGRASSGELRDIVDIIKSAHPELRDRGRKGRPKFEDFEDVFDL